MVGGMGNCLASRNVTMTREEWDWHALASKPTGAVMVKVDPRCQIASAFHDIAAVDRVYIRDAGEILRVFTVVDEESDAIFDAVYERERELIREFPDHRFDFNIIARSGRNVSDVLGHIAPAWQRQTRA